MTETLKFLANKIISEQAVRCHSVRPLRYPGYTRACPKGKRTEIVVNVDDIMYKWFESSDRALARCCGAEMVEYLVIGLLSTFYASIEEPVFVWEGNNTEDSFLFYFKKFSDGTSVAREGRR